MINITSQEMLDFSRFISEISWINIESSKKYLLENRLQEILESTACNSFHELLLIAKTDQNDELQREIIDSISTNETYFFRDQVPFETLKFKIIPDLIDRRKAQNKSGPLPIRIWCAACSTGQEVYSVIISLLETLPNIKDYEISVLGTDISSRVLAQASSGRYSAYEIGRGLPAGLQQKYFLEDNGCWRVKDEVRMMASFKRMNLMEPFYGIGPFDIILCRNVSIYFSEHDKIQLFKKISRILNKDGALIVGGSETLSGVAPHLAFQRHLKGIFYQHKDFVHTVGTPVNQVAKQGITSRMKIPLVQPSHFQPKATFLDTRYVKRKTKIVDTVRTDSVDKEFPALIKSECQEIKQPQTDCDEPLKTIINKDDRSEQIIDKGPPSSLLNQEKKHAEGTSKTLLESITRKKRGTASVFTRDENTKSENGLTLLKKIQKKHEKSLDVSGCSDD